MGLLEVQLVQSIYSLGAFRFFFQDSPFTCEQGSCVGKSDYEYYCIIVIPTDQLKILPVITTRYYGMIVDNK